MFLLTEFRFLIKTQFYFKNKKQDTKIDNQNQNISDGTRTPYYFIKNLISKSDGVQEK